MIIIYPVSVPLSAPYLESNLLGCLYSCLSLNLGRFLRNIIYTLFSSSETPTACVSVHVVVFHKSSVLCSTWASLKSFKIFVYWRAVSSFSGRVCVALFFSFDWAILLFLFMPCDFVVENWTYESNNVVTLEIRFSLLPGICWFLLICFYCKHFL